MRTVFLGTSDFAAAVLTDLAGAAGGAHRPALVITRPDRPAGRGRKLSSPPVARAARELGLELAQPGSVNAQDARLLIAATRPQAVLVCAFGALISEPLLSEHELLNLHPSLLPRWRGAAPLERAIMAGDERTGVSIMRVSAGLDSGPVCLVAQEPIGAQDTYGSLAPRLQRLGSRLLVETLERLQGGERLEFVEQDEQEATYAEKVAAADRLLDPARPAVESERTVRALHPHIGARLALPGGELLGVQRAALASDEPGGEPGVKEGAQTDRERRAARGARLYASGERLLLACTPGTLELLVVQPPGKRPMQASAYLRGHGLHRP
jgi:methionyl-tRNA formyltransferase